MLRRKNIITKRRALISYCSRSEVPRTLPGDGRGKPRQRIGRGKLPAVTFYCSRCTHRELKTAFFYCSRCTHRELLSVDIATDPVVLASARTVTSIKESSHFVRTVTGATTATLIVRGLLPENPAEESDGASSQPLLYRSREPCPVGRGKPRQRIGRGKLPAVTFYRSRVTARELPDADASPYEGVLASARTVKGATAVALIVRGLLSENYRSPILELTL